jgi:hypothetical protein
MMILGHKIKIRIRKHLVDDEGDRLLGAFVYEAKMIFLERGCDWKTVLLHEIIHAIVKLSGASAGLDYDKEESIVEGLEHGLSPIIFKTTNKTAKSKKR